MHDDAISPHRLNAPTDFTAGLGWVMAEYREAAIAYLRRVKGESPLSLNEIAQRVGVSHTTLTRPLNSASYKYVPKFGTLQKIADLTGIPLPRELTPANSGLPTTAPLSLLSVRGVVAAGMWQASELVQDEPLGVAPMVESSKYAGLRQWAELVRGPSMNRLYLDGDYLHVVDAGELGFFPRAGSVVIVERRSGQDGNVERTCKKIVAINDKLQLVGDSTVERWNQPLPLESGEDGTVNVVGLVIGFYRPGA